MDFLKFDERTRADEGVWVDMMHPNTGEPLIEDNGEPVQVHVRGSASRIVQQSLHDHAQRESKNKTEKQSMEGVHQKLMSAAKPLIIGFKNVYLGDVAVDASTAGKFLDLTFPQMGIKQDEDGNKVKNPDGSFVYEMVNKPFAVQIIEASSDHDRFLGNG